MTIDEILVKQRAAAERFLSLTEGNKELRLWSYDLKQIIKEQLRMIDALEYLRKVTRPTPFETKHVEMIMLGVEVKRG